MRVLLATDGSNPAGLAVDLVAGIEWPPDTTIEVVDAIENGPDLFGGPWPMVAYGRTDEIEADLLRIGRKSIQDVTGRLTRDGLRVDGDVRRGRPADVISDLATTSAPDLVVLGSRGHGAIESMLIGSVSSEVIDRAHAPVLVARGPRIERVLLAWDGSDSATSAVDLVKNWPIFDRSSVRVVAVSTFDIPWWTGFPDARSAQLMPTYVEAAEASRNHSQAVASSVVADLCLAGRVADFETRSGDAAKELIAVARAWKADVIVIGSHGRTGLQRLLLGSVARNVLHHAPCSVLVARARTATPGAS